MAHFFMENLPHRCPPGNASIVKNRVRAYRLVKNNPPQNSDFLSAKKLQPNRRFKNDCLALGVSVWTDASKCTSMLLLPSHRDEKLCKVIIERRSGFVLVDNRTKHVNWWPFSRCNILRSCEVIYENYV